MPVTTTTTSTWTKLINLTQTLLGSEDDEKKNHDDAFVSILHVSFVVITSSTIVRGITIIFCLNV